MKKVLSIILIAVMIATLSLTSVAADFVGSIEVKAAPEIVEISDGEKSYGAVIIDADTGSIQEGVQSFDENGDSTILEFFVISVAEKSEAAIDDIAENLTEAQEQIQNVETIDELDDGLGREIENVIDAFYEDAQKQGKTVEKIKVSDLVISDVFDASLVRDKDHLEQLGEGQKVRFMIKPNFTKNDFFVILHNTEGTAWEVVSDVEWTGDGNLIITVDKLSAFAIAVEKSADLPVDPDGPTSPDTATQNDFAFLYIVLAVVCGCVAVFCFINSKKAEKKD